MSDPVQPTLTKEETERRERFVIDACEAFDAGDAWQSRADVEDFMREALGLPANPHSGEVCEGSMPEDPCLPVAHHDGEGVPLCAKCYEDLSNEVDSA